MDLKMEVYSPSLELLGLLEIQNSVIWERKAFSSGSFSLTSLITEEALSLLTPENIIWIAGEDAGIIEYVQEEAGENGPYITVKGSDLTGILARRILWGQYDLSGPVPELMYRLVEDCCVNPTRGDVEARKIPGLVLSDAPTGGTSIRTQKTGGTLLEALEGLGEAYQTVFGVRFNPAVPQMEFWARPGVNRSVHQTANEPVFYSAELDDVLSSEYSYNAQDYKNLALVAGEGEGNARVHVIVSGNGGDEPSPPTPPTPPSPTKYTITLSVDPSGGGVASGGGSVESGKSIAVTASPASGYTFAGWKENGTVVSSDTTYTFTVTGDRTLVAVFSVIIPTYTVTVSIDPSGSGTVTGAGTYQEGEQVTLTATAVDGYTFAAWKVNGMEVGTGESYTFTVTGNVEAVAVFEIESQYEAGRDWWAATLPSSAQWRSVAYGNGKFVAVAFYSTKSAYSVDGITWTASTLPSSANWNSVTYGNGRFVAVAYGSNKAAYSTDGITWTAASFPSSTKWTSVTFGNSKFVAVAYGSNKAAYSTDGITWTASTLPSSVNWNSVTYGNGRFVAVADRTENATYSTDGGDTWETATLPSSSVYWFSVTYGDGRFVAVAFDSAAAAYSSAKGPNA